MAADVDETPLPGEAPLALARRLSQLKAQTVAAQRPDALILASDTVVAYQNEILGKPLDDDDARRMLRLLCGRDHLVVTAVTGLDSGRPFALTLVNVSVVWMRAYAEAEIEAYVASGDPHDKAGAYAIQHPVFRPAARLDGCFSGVMGFPLGEVVQVLTALGVPPPGQAAQACDGWRGGCCQADGLAGRPAADAAT